MAKTETSGWWNKITDPVKLKRWHDMNILKSNKVPWDPKGNESSALIYQLEDEDELNYLIDAMMSNTTFTGYWRISSTKFNDSLGWKIAKIIANNTLDSLTIWNRNHPFSDRVSWHIGQALEHNTTMKNLEIFLETKDVSPIYIIKFLANPNSKLTNWSYLQLTDKFCRIFSEYVTGKSPLTKLNFYYEPLKEVNWWYEKEIKDTTLDILTSQIENSSNWISVNAIPLEEKFPEDINEKLTNDIDIFNKTVMFSCNIVKKEKESQTSIDEMFQEQNKKIDLILKTIDRGEGKENKNSIVSIRSYWERAIGESLNQALYDWEVQRERFPEKKELFTAKESIKHVAQYLWNNKG